MTPTPAQGACTAQGPTLGSVLVTDAATAVLFRSHGPAILPTVVTIITAHREQGEPRSDHEVGGNLLGNVNNLYRAPTALIPLLAGTVGNVGGSQPHTNMSPYLVINLCIALIGIFPSQN